MAHYTNWNVLMWDINLGSEYDLQSSAKRRMIGEWINCGWVIGLHLGTPCDSFTRVRNVPPGPPPLRSDACPLGLPGLRPGVQLKVLTGNLWLRFWTFCIYGEPPKISYMAMSTSAGLDA